MMTSTTGGIRAVSDEFCTSALSLPPPLRKRAKKESEIRVSDSLRLRRQAGLQQIRRLHLPLAALVDVVIEQGF